MPIMTVATEGSIANRYPAWNATTNTPTLTSSVVGALGTTYLVSVAGTTSLNGIASWAIGDIAVFAGGVWTKKSSLTSPEMTPYIVGTSTGATYSTFNAAFLAAAPAASSIFPQFVYGQPLGVVNEDLVFQPNVHLVAMGATPNTVSPSSNTAPLKIIGHHTFADVNTTTNIVGVYLGNSAASPCLDLMGTSSTININLVGSTIEGVTGDGIKNDNPAVTVYVKQGSTVQATVGFKPYNFTAGEIDFLENSNDFAVGATSSMTNGIVNYQSANIKDSPSIGSTSTITVIQSAFLPLGTNPAISVLDNASTAIVTDCVISNAQSSGYAIVGNSSSTIKSTGNTFTNTAAQVSPGSNRSSYKSHLGPISFDQGATYLTVNLQGDASVTIPSGTSILNTYNFVVLTGNTTVAPNTVYSCQGSGNINLTLPASGFASGQWFEVSGINTGGLDAIQITQLLGQQIIFGNQTTSGGAGTKFTGAQRNSVFIRCVVANSLFQVISSIGTWSVT